MLLITAIPSDPKVSVGVIDPVNSRAMYTIQDVDWVPMPEVLPEKPLSRYEFGPHDAILALRRGADGNWGTVFLPARLVTAPSKRLSPKNERGYELQFGDGTKGIVPEKFAVLFPPHWKAGGPGQQ